MANRSMSNPVRGFLTTSPDPFDGHVTDPNGDNLRRADGESVSKGFGRPKGSKNQITSEARAFALEIVRSPEYRKSLLTRVAAGTLPANIEAMLWAYAYGRPTERVEVTHISPAAQLAEMSVQELAERAALIAKVLTDVGDVEAAELAMKMVDTAQEARNLAAIDAEIVERIEREKAEGAA